MNQKDKRGLSALDRLKTQLINGTKSSGPLTEPDKTRIGKEINILETKLKPYLS